MICLTTDEVIRLHEKLLSATGGSPGLRDQGLLESAVWSADAAFGNVERYPSIEEKAARLSYALISNHAFVDGNKRIGILALLVTLDLNDVALQYSQTELIELGLAVANGQAKFDDILVWIYNHKLD
ncbi:type II toxin-antitoxin system death-on-curing family toxin [Acutalibacter muris]|jgi:death-on-curing protein|uniref:Type II toxin-antitoxin system death-on-curing family toxin n=1 Tax=Acutalibacter muris TaxID=1796620 RepID=A0A1Z2XU95_9FIRM|nr:type II toxin-antitoxin system death-on-curing family toxin [Acutalibacter muris]ANU54757.1 death-on-curing protein [Hungateiclostridiaceae bacterium KB18]ASB42012.1 type II toxin-antitoxin system death-on-curing family toxin [Acutalibacter muris]QQR31279.1 type II toxin-antitoxin system death-on-curing family toxin [Acutalibacter muris]